jgi:ferritin-like metal-binding protein YciE
MTPTQQKVVQYLNEAHATEQALTRVLQSQIAMTPRGSYRSGLETHLSETRDHAARVAERLEALGQGSNPLIAMVGLAAWLRRPSRSA